MLRDDLDRKILAELVENARAPFGAIGERVGLSAPAVKRRVDRLVRDGVIRGFTATLDDEALGANTEAFVELTCRSRTNPADIREMLAGLDGVADAYTVTGEADALVHVKTATPAELETVVEQIRAHQNAERTKTTIVLSRVVGS
ncbi:MAG TPA: Lrp/AsnC family transcriptional regulator [Acidimicrobiia bacterium]|nr:Lrp/AsnC family transcriptional regulator [Acidimicrobiia bacterium]